ncbi:MAG: hypothetical protein Q9195_002998 [Heterodermia aff. obscurata]
MDLLKHHMRSFGFSVESVGLPTVGCPGLSVDDDARFLEMMLLRPLIEQQGKDIILYLHSYAGFPGSTAIAGYSKEERLAQGKAGGILGLVYQSAFIPRLGDTILHVSGGDYATWQNPNTLSGLIDIPDPKVHFFADVMEPRATEAIDQLRSQSTLSFNSPAAQTYYGIAAYDNRRIYLCTNYDEWVHHEVQEMYMARSGVMWYVKRLNTGHDPFLVNPAYLALILVACTMDFLDTYMYDITLA